jgi:hypothetical protein
MAPKRSSRSSDRPPDWWMHETGHEPLPWDHPQMLRRPERQRLSDTVRRRGGYTARGIQPEDNLESRYSIQELRPEPRWSIWGWSPPTLADIFSQWQGWVFALGVIAFLVFAPGLAVLISNREFPGWIFVFAFLMLVLTWGGLLYYHRKQYLEKRKRRNDYSDNY